VLSRVLQEFDPCPLVGGARGPSAVVAGSVGAERAGGLGAGDGLGLVLQRGDWGAVAGGSVVAEGAGAADLGDGGGVGEYQS
jgi:hypothetical protein